MATVISTLFISLDGIAEVSEDWHFPYFDEQMGAAVTEDYEDVDVLVLGRVTYDSFAGAWPDREAAGEDDAQFARQLGDVRKVVATRGDQELGWRNVERTADVVGTVRALRDDPAVGKVLLAGSLSVVRQLLDAGLLDELRLLVHPVAVRRGERLFTDAPTIRPFALLRHEATPRGVLRAIYAPADLPDGGSYEEAAEHLTQA
ncbi:dihydrofolate reductase family protein [Cellulomonas xiejunii]|uniref:Dihydrofolate reductase family protein n=1 Tax=Cellulomonas xiejunii TaxID=2968083 RepID=A0ABY5KSI8_9CELL|nr:dihydrofolate reductase family protein [Cellulomonas xiejunii]MCC2313976.1 dihydrofolate reductase family protein [Cellulomonas xiejunii]MCC2322381.1 dihydrofolate reductase family protein [Cellulomonas xiejunii]UUI72431.1 dihydrofolate reductase family protein [Cellulomonas xiejunii]